MRLIVACLIMVSAIVASFAAEAQIEKTRTVYAHAGNGAWGAGFLKQGEKWAFGLDFGIEGESSDQTSGGETTEDGASFNLLVGAKVFENQAVRIVPFGLLGARRYKTTCPAGQSHIGFRCFADTRPETHFKVNYGGGVIVHTNRLAVGVRVTGESTTAILGWNF